MIFTSTFGIICQISSLVGLVATFIEKSWAIYVALSFICLAVLSFIVAFFVLLSKRFGEKYPEGFKRVASFCFYKTEDGINISCDTKRIIQSKSLCLSEIDHKFKWTGRNTPKFSAEPHHIVATTKTTGSGDYAFDVNKVKLDKPLLYNETGVICVNAIVEDKEKISGPFLSHRVDFPVELLVFSILLGDKSSKFCENAILSRKKIDSMISNDYELIKEISFEQKHKRYYVELKNPDVGYYYKIEWKR